MINKIIDRWFMYWLVIILAIFSATLLLHNGFSYLDPDFGWHYQVGQEIWQSRHLPSIEHHLFPIAGQLWVDHEWLTNLSIFILSSWGGYLLVNFFFASIILLTWWVLARSTIKQWLKGRADSFMLWILLLLGLKASFPHFGVRVQEVTVLLLLVLNLWLAAVVRRRRWQWWEMIVLPVLFWLWACWHGGFLIGLAVMATWTALRLVLYLLKRYRYWSASSVNILPSQMIKQSVVLVFLSFIATCLTPYGLKLYGFLSDYQSHRAYLSLIQEWQPMTEAIWSWRMLYSLVFGLAIALLLLHWRSRRAEDRRIINWLWQQDWWQLLFSMILFVAAWRSLRHFPLFVVISLPWLVGFYYRSWQDHHFQPNKWPNYLKWFISAILLVSSAAIIIGTNWINHPEQAYCSKYPCAAMDYLRQSPYSGWPTLVDYSWGGYFYWQWPEKKIFIDGRLPQYPWRDRTLIEHYARFFNESDVKSALNDYDLSVVVIGQPPVVSFNWLETWLLGRGQRVEDYNSSQEIMRRAMLKLPNWRLAYSDAVTTIYVRQ